MHHMHIIWHKVVVLIWLDRPIPYVYYNNVECAESTDLGLGSLFLVTYQVMDLLVLTSRNWSHLYTSIFHFTVSAQ